MAVAMATFSTTPLVLAPLATEFAVPPVLRRCSRPPSSVRSLSARGRRGESSTRPGASSSGRDPVGGQRRGGVRRLVRCVGRDEVGLAALGVLTWLAYSQVFGDDERTGASPQSGHSRPLCRRRSSACCSNSATSVRCSSCSPASRWCPRLGSLHRRARPLYTGRNRAVRGRVGHHRGPDHRNARWLGRVRLHGSDPCRPLRDECACRSRWPSRPRAGQHPDGSLPRSSTLRRWLLRTHRGLCGDLDQADQSAVLWVVLCLWGNVLDGGARLVHPPRRAVPTERAGDAQAAMAFGRRSARSSPVRWLPVVMRHARTGRRRAACGGGRLARRRRVGGPADPGRGLAGGFSTQSAAPSAPASSPIGPSRSRPRVGTGAECEFVEPNAPSRPGVARRYR